jgi:hypothetical protein
VAKGTGKLSASPATDARGDAVVDPTANVLLLVEAANRRQDDLRSAESRRVDEQAILRDRHAAELRAAESARLDAIRAVDVANAASAALITSAQATTLAAQVEASRQATAAALATALAPITATLAELQRVQYEQQGQKVASTEQRTDKVDTRTWLIAAAAVVVAAIVGIAPHIH